jgi:hypothetical protein
MRRRWAPPPERDRPNPCVQDIPKALFLLLVLALRHPDRMRDAWKETGR